MSYDNTNTGMLSRNERKEKDSHPDFSGFINVEGREFWLSGWTKEGKEGSKMAGKRFFSLAIKAKEQQAEPAPKQQKRNTDTGFDRMDDDIPFIVSANDYSLAPPKLRRLGRTSF